MSGRLALFANLILLGFLAAFAWLASSHPSVYYQSVQEDQALEWATFWSFFVAAGMFVHAARLWRRDTGTLPWFLAGLSLFCFFVAMEEISWGQRIFGQLPPEYFLARNYQQELNLHNIASTSLRLFAFRGIIFGYGVLLPLVTLVPPAQRLLERIGIAAPPVELTPAMFAMFWVHLWYPWKFTGEIVECALGFGFLFVAVASIAQHSPTRGRSSLVKAGLTVLVITGLGFATAYVSQHRQSSDPATLARATAETQALKDDLVAAARTQDRKAVSKCGTHKRVYTFVQQTKRARSLERGIFAALVESGLPEARAEFFLDPWASPYWIRDRCDRDQGRRVVFVYSLGPNRSRDSSRWEILGDDIGQYVLVEP